MGVLMFYMTAGSTGGGGSKFTVDGLLNGLISKLTTWGAGLVVIIGIIMVIWAVVQIAKGLMSGGRSQTNWVTTLLLLFIGGALAFTGGWRMLKAVSGGASGTLKEIGSQSDGSGLSDAESLGAEWDQ